MLGNLSRISWIAAMLAMSLALFAGRSAASADGRPLPSFTLTAADGTGVSSAALGTSGSWLLIYAASPECVACERLLRALDEWAIAGSATRIVVVVGDAGQATTVGAGRRTFTDPGGSAGQALAVTDVPAVIGVRDGRIEWTVQGVLNEPSMLKGLIERWLGQ